MIESGDEIKQLCRKQDRHLDTGRAQFGPHRESPLTTIFLLAFIDKRCSSGRSSQGQMELIDICTGRHVLRDLKTVRNVVSLTPFFHIKTTESA